MMPGSRGLQLIAVTGMMVLFLAPSAARATGEPVAAILIGLAADMSAMPAIGEEAGKHSLVMAIDDLNGASSVLGSPYGYPGA